MSVRRKVVLVLVLGCLLIASISLTTFSPPTGGGKYTPRIIDGRHVLVVGPREVSTKVISFKLEGVEFHVPLNRLDTILETDPVHPDELRSGFGMVAQLPDLASKTAETISTFLVPSQVSNLVTVNVERSCLTTSAPQCSPEWAMEILRKIYVPDLRPPPMGLGDRGVPGLRLVGHSPELMGKPIKLEVYEPESVRQVPGFIICHMQNAKPVPHCNDYYYWKNGIYVKISYQVQHIVDWRRIEIAVDAMLESFVVGSPGYRQALPSYYFPRRNRVP